jgi:hypothetical protein
VGATKGYSWLGSILPDVFDGDRITGTRVEEEENAGRVLSF